MEGQSGVTRSIIYKFHYPISNEIKWKVTVVLVKVSMMNLVLLISKETKFKVKVVLLEVSLMNFILWISKELK